MPASLRVNDLVLDVPGKRILDLVNLEVEPGSILAIMGMSGCGKTSLLKCMAGLRRPSSGSIKLDGVDLATLSEREFDTKRRQIGLVFQYAALFDSLCVRDNVAFGVVHHQRLGRKEVDQLVADRLDEVEMAGTERLYPSELSGGMQKRVGLARALATEPQILLYDEPTSGLDPVIARTIDDLIVHTRDRLGLTSVVVSHDVGSIFRIADRIALMSAGKIVATGTPQEMRESFQTEVIEFLGAVQTPLG